MAQEEKVKVQGYLPPDLWLKMDTKILNRNIGRKPGNKIFSQSDAVVEALELWVERENMGGEK